MQQLSVSPSCVTSTSQRFLPGVLGAAPVADAEDVPVGEGLRDDGEEEPDEGVRPVRRAPGLVPDVPHGGAGVRLRGRREHGRLPDRRHLRRHVHGRLRKFTREESIQSVGVVSRRREHFQSFFF